MNQAIAYLNGDYVPLADAKISVLDRGFIFGDGVYEVIPVYARQAFRLDEHLQRLQNSLDAVRISNPYSLQQWGEIIDTVIDKNEPEHQSLYLQVTRGIAKRDHAFPANTTPTVFMMSNPLQETDEATFNRGVAIVSMDDIRWQYCNIKAITLLPNILLRQQAVDQNAQEAVLIRDDRVTEGAASNIFIVSNGTIKTPPKGSLLLPGITRDLVVELARANDMPLEETFFSKAELDAADEIWLTSSTKEIMPVLTLDGKTVGNGTPGPITQKIYSIFQNYKNNLKQTDTQG